MGASSDVPSFTCCFWLKGFVHNGLSFPPCNVRYHLNCIRVGPPFRSRFREAGRGLQYPKEMLSFPFVCELCTVRCTLERGLRSTQSDQSLLGFERMRMIDMAHSWAPSTLKKTHQMLSHLRTFHNDLFLPGDWLYVSPTLPAHGPPVKLCWSLEEYTTRPSARKNQDFVGFPGARGLRSAAYAAYTWQCVFETEQRIHRSTLDRTVEGEFLGGGPASHILTQLTVAGMKRRLGTESTPSMPIHNAHVLWNTAYRRDRFADPATPRHIRLGLLLANVAELFLWLSWVRGCELFGLRWCDVEIIPPAASRRRGLPANTGALLLRLLDSTKSDPTKQADVVVAYSTAGGHEPGFWFTTLLSLVAPRDRSALIFRHASGGPWDSRYFRAAHVYPLLHLQRLGGDPYLSAFDGTPGNTITDKLWSLHMFRRGGNTHTRRHRPPCIRKATKEERDEHGRWRRRHTGNEPMQLHYDAPPLEDRLYITLLCM
jgi:hypothetical protein